MSAAISPSRPLCTALGMWGVKQWGFAAAVAAGVALLIGLATVLIPNPVFGREIPPVWWNYPVWLLTSALAGMLAATYLTPQPRPERRSSRMGVAGTILAWFAVGCPVCNKLALLALGYSGALAWFAPIQPYLALGALALTAAALALRLRGQLACPAGNP